MSLHINSQSEIPSGIGEKMLTSVGNNIEIKQYVKNIGGL
jgi:hypothetical protein